MMTAHLVGEQEVEILEVVGPGQLAVRPLSFSSHYDRLQNQLQQSSQELEKLSRPNLTELRFVLWRSLASRIGGSGWNKNL